MALVCRQITGANIVPELARHFALTVIDMPGHGSSSVFCDATPSINLYSDRIAEVLSNSPEPMYVAGHSMGALISVDLADRYPTKVKAITVLNGIFQRNEDATQAVRSRAKELDGKHMADFTATLARWFGDEPTGVDAHATERCRHWLTNINPLGYQQAYRAFAYDNGPSAECLKSLECAALFITGEHEPNSTADMSAAMAQLVPKGRCHIVQGAKHMMPMTHGGEVCAQMIEFFESVGAATQAHPEK